MWVPNSEGVEQMRCLGFANVLFFIAVSNVGIVFGCTCNVSPPPCYEFWRTDAVFIGTVKKVHRDDSFPFDKVEIGVEENFRGMSSSVAETYNYGHSCAHTFKDGEKYLFYGSIDKDVRNRIATGLCNRTSQFNDSIVDFEFLRSLRSNESAFWIWGTISEIGFDIPLRGIRAEILGQKKKLHGISDELGNIKIEVPRQGKYTVRVHLPKGTRDVNGLSRNDRTLWEEQMKQIVRAKLDGQRPFIDYNLDVKANRCGWFDVSIPIHN